MSDIFSKTLTGNLVDDATYKELSSEKSPINFVLATNFSNGKKVYTNCVFWVATKANPEILKYLRKGTKLTVNSNYFETESWEDANGQKKYKDITYVSQFVLGGKPADSQKSNSDSESEASNVEE